jgi:hypothetical protein
MMKTKKTRLLGLLFVATAAIAATWGPFIVSTYFPGINIADDVEYMYASLVPRLVMNTSVQNIKPGDQIRVIYSNGEIYNFEAFERFSAFRSVNRMGNPRKRPTSTAPAVPSPLAMNTWRMLNCRSGGGLAMPVGTWTSTSSVASNGTVVVTGGWTQTGTQWIC